METARKAGAKTGGSAEVVEMTEVKRPIGEVWSKPALYRQY